MDSVDHEARQIARDAKHAASNHAQLMDIKIDNLAKELRAQLTRLENILKWAGSLLVTLFISTLVWSLTQQYNANESQKRDLQQQVQLLEAQQRANAAQAELNARAAEARSAALSNR